MQLVKGITLAGKETINAAGHPLEIPVFEDENGVDWRTYHPKFEADTWKLLVDKFGMVRGYSQVADSFGLDGEEFSVVELAASDLPSSFFDPHMFTAWSWFEDKGVVRRELPEDENLETNKVLKTCLIADITRQLQPLQMAEKYGEQTKAEKKKQETLERLLIKVGRIDPNDRNIDWPVVG